ncbi:histidine kinase [Uliginosibacterium sp. H3]|uniref:Histidine kinase n=1 Tax=Uliginosibacterium silvisoli TaxID=3114758 RepID=A0ABU6K658_9RHOO|nr:histidine kinase [Uliginosibacterium sp. H3]
MQAAIARWRRSIRSRRFGNAFLAVLDTPAMFSVTKQHDNKAWAETPAGLLQCTRGVRPERAKYPPRVRPSDSAHAYNHNQNHGPASAPSETSHAMPRAHFIIVLAFSIFGLLVLMLWLHATGANDSARIGVAILSGLAALLAGVIPALLMRAIDLPRALYLAALVPGIGLGVWIWRYFMWHDLGMQFLPQYSPMALTVPALSFALVAAAALYHDVRMRLLKHRRLAETAERESLEAQLRTLQAQVDPDFLFGTLRAIDARIEEAPEDARGLLTLLNRYLRTSLSQARGKLATLEAEFALLEAYLGIASARRDGQVHSTLSCAEDCTTLDFPPMLLQPLVELAIARAEDGARIAIAANRADKHVEIRLRDAAGRLSAALSRKDAPLQEVANRLHALFGVHASLLHADSYAPESGIVMRVPIDRSRGFQFA